MEPPSPEKTYDLAIIGGGIAGVAAARDAVLRGLSVIVLEKNSLGSGASSKSSKLIHGGIRYLELAWQDLAHLRPGKAFRNFRFVLSSLRESAILARTAPDLIRPIRLAVPIYRRRGRAPWVLYSGTLFYGWLSRILGNDAAPRLHRGTRAALALLPLLNPENLQGAVEISDHTTDDLALVKAVAAAAQRHGAVILEQARARSWEKTADGYRLSHDGPGSPVCARALVNASGPWIDKTRAAAKKMDARYVLPIGGSHIELPAFLGHSTILEARDGRVFFVVEKNGRARVGTTEWPCNDPDAAPVPAGDVAYLLQSLESYFPSKKWAVADILSSDAGVRPLAVDSAADQAARLSREHVLHEDAEGVFHLTGVKLTDHRRAAEETIDRVAEVLGLKKRRSKTAVTPLSF